MDLTNETNFNRLKLICFDDNSHRYLYMYIFNAEEFNLLLSNNNNIVNCNLSSHGLMVNTPKGIKRIKLIEKGKKLNVKFITIGDTPILSHQIQDLILSNIPSTEIFVFKLILSDNLYYPSDLFLIERKESVKFFGFCINKINNTKRNEFNKRKLMVSAQSLLMIHLFMGINPNTFFEDNQLENNVDWTGIYKFKIE